MPSTQSGVTELLLEHREDLHALMEGLSSAHLAALERVNPSLPLHKKFLHWALDWAKVSFEALLKRPKPAVAWVVVCFLAALITWGTYDSKPGLAFLTELVLPMLAIGALFFFGPALLFGWPHLAPSLKKWFGDTGASALAAAEVRLFVSEADDPITGKLSGYSIAQEGAALDLMPKVENVTTLAVPTPYVRIVLAGGHVSHLLNAATGAHNTWFHGMKVLEEHHATYASAFVDECRKAGLLEALGELSRLVGGVEAPAQVGPTFEPKRAPVVTGTTSSWNSLVLEQAFKEELMSVCEMLKHADVLRAQGFEPPASLLLVGPPGVGKTEVARTMANESKLHFFHASAGDVKARHIGHSAHNVREFFEEARRFTPAIAFMDELDVLAPRRDGESQDSDSFSKDVVAEMLVQLDGVIKHQGDVFLMAATNFPDRVDPAILSRFKQRKEIPLPDREARRQLLDVFVGDKASDEDVGEALDGLADATAGASGRDLKSRVDAAAARAIARALKEGTVHAVQLRAADFLDLVKAPATQ